MQVFTANALAVFKSIYTQVKRKQEGFVKTSCCNSLQSYDISLQPKTEYIRLV